jgi:hypothetical protein
MVLAAYRAARPGLTYYDTIGPTGVIESPDGSPNPAAFFSLPDTPYLLAVVLADACSLAGSRGGAPPTAGRRRSRAHCRDRRHSGRQHHRVGRQPDG